MQDKSLTNEIRSAKVEQFLLDKACELGVVRRVEFSNPTNPNKWGKTLAPWFTEECREAKRARARAVREHGRDSEEAKEAAVRFRRLCVKGKRAFATELPDMLKYAPKRFWGMLKPRGNTDV